MKLAQGKDLFEAKHDFIIVTGNATIKSNGAVVMGRGAAKQLRDKVKGIDLEFGKQITNNAYGLIIVRNLGLFQVKYNWWEDANLNLISSSVEMLTEFANSIDNMTVGMNFPGIGNGRLHYQDVLPIINRLPNNVYVYSFGVWENG